VIENSGEHKKPYNNKCDLFSFGIIAHMLLLGYNPVKGDSYDETYLKNKLCEININKALAVSKGGEHCFIFLTKLLSKYPQFRFDADQALKS
jgi:serine/threonine protein kinase